MKIAHIAFCSSLLMPFAGTATAADISPSRDELCKIVIAGELIAGDYDEFVALAGSQFPAEVLESTADNTVCLDSPGGNLAEGVKFARHFYKEGVGTVVGDDAECHSACAIMFMMGTAQGGEVAFANRKMHVSGTIGFHRPYLPVPAGPQVDVAILALAYDSAFQDALDLIAIGNSKAPWTSEPMMKSDLMQAMLEHVGNDIYLIDTVDKAARFEIDLVGAELSPTLTEEAAFYACHNALQWQHSLSEEDITYTAERAEPMTGYRTVQSISARPGTTAFQVIGVKDGYASHRCVVTETERRVFACGVDDYTGTSLGAGECGPGDYESKLAHVRPLALYNPNTLLASLREGGPSRSSALAQTRCFVRSAGVLEDDDPCDFVASRTQEGWEMATFVWPSGSRTVLVRAPTGIEINGVATEGVEVPELGRCYPNARTGKEFCVRFGG